MSRQCWLKGSPFCIPGENKYKQAVNDTYDNAMIIMESLLSRSVQHRTGPPCPPCMWCADKSFSPPQALPWGQAGRPWAVVRGGERRTGRWPAWGRSRLAGVWICPGMSAPGPRSPPDPSWTPRCPGTAAPPARTQRGKEPKRLLVSPVSLFFLGSSKNEPKENKREKKYPQKDMTWQTERRRSTWWIWKMVISAAWR